MEKLLLKKTLQKQLSKVDSNIENVKQQLEHCSEYDKMWFHKLLNELLDHKKDIAEVITICTSRNKF